MNQGRIMHSLHAEPARGMGRCR